MLLILFEAGVGHAKLAGILLFATVPIELSAPLAQVKIVSIDVPAGVMFVGRKPKPSVNVVMCCQNAGSAVLTGTSLSKDV